MDSSSRPIFILGAARSGTSIINYALRYGAEIPNYNESHVFPLLHRLYQTVENYYGYFSPDYLSHTKAHMISNLPEQEIKDRLAEFFTDFCAKTFSSEVWIDKTPSAEMINTVPLLANLYPKARFIFAKRRGIENIQSRLRKFGDSGFVNHCHEWTACMSAWRKHRDKIPGRGLEIDQRDIALNPEEVSRQLAEFLGLSLEGETEVNKTLIQDRPEQSAAAMDHKYVDLEETGWTQEQKDAFREICGPMMEAYGYPLGGKTFTSFNTQRTLRLYHTVVPSDIDIRNVPENGFGSLGGGLLLHPGSVGEPPATALYKRFVFEKHNRFVCVPHLRTEESGPVRFRLQVIDKASGEVVVEDEKTVSPGEEREWSIEFAPLSGEHEVLISTEMAPGAESNFRAWAVWGYPRFEVSS